MFQLQTNVGDRFTLNKEPAKREALSTSKGVKSIPNEITLAGEHINISKGNSVQIRDQEKYWNFSVVSQAATAIKAELKKHILLAKMLQANISHAEEQASQQCLVLQLSHSNTLAAVSTVGGSVLKAGVLLNRFQNRSLAGCASSWQEQHKDVHSCALHHCSSGWALPASSSKGLQQLEAPLKGLGSTA